MGSSYTGDIAIDDVAITSGSCPSIGGKGRTIRKVMGGGRGEFSSSRNFFSLSNSLYEFFQAIV